MKNRKKYIIGLMLLLICSIISGYFMFVKEEKIIITSMLAPDIQEQIEEYKRAGKCNDGYFNEAKTEVVLELTKWQRKKWLNSEYKNMEKFISLANDIDHMQVFISEDTKKMFIYADKDVSFQNMATYFGMLSYSIELIQVLNYEEKWGFEFVLSDMDTKKIIYTVDFPEEDVVVNESMWDDIEE